ncbi:hypothetical protein CRG98_011962 [Punica granatum]|uniref:Uncharacterized protein n=1 Tax=Punica granatum TaxID=22663 RepID=A0A2I0KH22_PUNGR|nr:hypothetical protein CRG98_011962 [Punica granatum]
MGEERKQPEPKNVDGVHSQLPPTITESQVKRLDRDESGAELYGRHVKAIGSISSKANVDESIDCNDENPTSIVPIPSEPYPKPTTQRKCANLWAGKKPKRDERVFRPNNAYKGTVASVSPLKDRSFRNERFKMRTFDAREGDAAGTGVGGGREGGQKAEVGASAMGGRWSISCWPRWFKGCQPKVGPSGRAYVIICGSGVLRSRGP